MINITCGIASHTIFAHDPLLVNDPVPVTKACINAVMDYMVDDIPKGETSVGYERKYSDGRKVKLVCILEE